MKNVYALYDEKACCYANPFISANDATALRSLSIAAKDPQSEISSYPNDFTLYNLATFDDANGAITPHTQPINIGRASQFITEA